MATYTVGTGVQALVADIGTFSTKIGYAGDDHPKAIYSSTTAVERGNANNNNGSNFISPPKRDFVYRCVDGKDSDGNFDLVNPVDPVTGWLFSPPDKNRSRSLSSNEGDCKMSDPWESHELVSHYLQHAFQNLLGGGSSPSSLDLACHHPLLLLDKPHTPPALRQRLLEIMFETHNLPAMFFLRDAVAACYAVGKTTATVVDVGYSSTMVTPVYDAFVETRGVLRNSGCSARAIEEGVLKMMDTLVNKQGGRRRKDRLKRINQRKLEKEMESSAANSSSNSNANSASGSPQTKRTSVKRDAAGHFVREKASQPSALAPIPDYLMPVYQVRRAPSYTARKEPFHHWSRLTLAREIKEMGLGVAVGPMGYTSSDVRVSGQDATATDSFNPATANSMFLASSKLPYTLPDGTPVEISTASRCDVVEILFGNDEYNINYREQALDRTCCQLEEYENEIEEYLVKQKEEANEKDSKLFVGDNNDSAAAGDPYSNTSYRGEKSSRHAGVRNSGKKIHYSPNTISTKLYAACLPYIRTSPPTANAGDRRGNGLDGLSSIGTSSTAGGGSAIRSTRGGSVNDNYFHYLTSVPPAQMVCDAAYRCDRDQQAALLGNVVVCGGGSCITGVTSAVSGGGMMASGADTLGTDADEQGGGVVASALGDEQALPDRLREEIESIVHRHTPGWRVKVTSPNIADRAICSWLGGSILGSLGTFQDMWVSKKDYEEFGAAIVNRKCP